jgi:hypothetical protein
MDTDKLVKIRTLAAEAGFERTPEQIESVVQVAMNFMYELCEKCGVEPDEDRVLDEMILSLKDEL